MKFNIESKSDFVQMLFNIVENNSNSPVDGSTEYGRGYRDALMDVFNSWDEIYQAHRIDSAIQDAKNHLLDYIEDDAEYEKVINSGIPEVIAERFLDNHDCNVAENDQYESIIESVLKENGF